VDGSTFAGVRCVECGRKSRGDATDWRAYLTEDPEGHNDAGVGVLEAVVYCPDCAEHEFGPLTPRHAGRSDLDWPPLPPLRH
jgi:hypothetical protein